MQYIPNILFLILLLIGSGFFIKNSKKIIRNIKLGHKVDASDHKKERWINVLRIALGQSKIVVRPIAGILHVVVYVGFVIINIEVLEIIIDGLFGTHRIFSSLGIFYNILIFSFEMLAFLVLVSVIVFWMEYDFSDKAKGFLESQIPNEPSECGKRSDVGDKVVASLKNKVEEHNKKHPEKVTLEQLKKVYRRGAGACSSSHRPGKSMTQWAIARVNTFLKMVRGGEVKESYRASDKDLAVGDEDYYIEEIGAAFIDYNEVEFGS